MKGLTLIELVVTLAVIAVLVAIGMPALQGTSQSGRLTAAINSLTADFAFARSEAVTRNTDVRVRTVSGDTDWSQGWIVEALPAGGPAVTIRNGKAVAANILFTGDAASLTYNSDGSQEAGGSLTFKTCQQGDTSAHGREIRVNLSGRVKLVKNQPCP
jgi:type IV fimbrial biogenesis protein FimT